MEKPKRQVRCYGCGELGHIRRFCPNVKREKVDPAHKAKVAEGNHSDNDGAFAASVGSLCRSQSKRWLVDSGASSHMTRQKELLVEYIAFDRPEKVALGDGKTVEALGIGNVAMQMLFDESIPKRATLYQVLYVPKLACNLFSVRAAVAKGNSVKFGPSRCWIRDANGKLKGMGILADKLYQLNCQPLPTEYAAVATEQCNTDLWHQRFGHVNEQQLQDAVHHDMVTGAKVPRKVKLGFCQSCVEGKMHRMAFKPVGEIRSTRRLELVHSDVCGPMPTESIGGCKYFVMFIDDFSRCCNVYFMKRKSEVPEKFKEFEAATTSGGTLKIGTLRSDNGGEYLSEDFKKYLESKDVHHELTVPYSPEQNGVAERMNRTLVESARTLIAHAGLPDCYWAEAISTTAYVRNRMPTNALKEPVTPYEKWYGRKPNVQHLRVFGCIAYAHVPDVARQKLDKKAEKLRFIGYSKASKGYRLINEKTKKVVVRRDVLFNETDFGCVSRDGSQIGREVLEFHVDDDTVSAQSERNSATEPRRSGRAHRPVVRYGIDEYHEAATVGEEISHIACHAGQIEEPKTIEEALSSGNAKEWKTAADAEFESLMENETWELVEPPRDKNIIGSKWVFRVKVGLQSQVRQQWQGGKV